MSKIFQRGHLMSGVLFLPSFPVYLSAYAPKKRGGSTTHAIEGLDGCELRIGLYWLIDLLGV